MLWRSSFNSRIAQITDFLTAFLGFIFAYFHWQFLYSSYSPHIPKPGNIDFAYLFLFALLSLMYVGLFKQQKAYSYQRFTSLASEYGIVFKVSVLGILLDLAIAFFLNYASLRRTFFILAFLNILVLFTLQKSLLFYVAHVIRKQGKDRKRVLIIGTGTRARQFIETVHKNFAWGLDIVGLLTGDRENVGKSLYGARILDTYDHIESLLKELNPEEVIITISTRRFDHIRDVLEACEKVGVKVRLNSDFFGHITKNVQVDNVFGLSIISFEYTRQTEAALFLKRTMDIVISGMLLVLLIPVLAIVGLMIAIEDGKPIFYRWKVVGKNRKPFTSWKLRTMVRNADELKKQLMGKNEMSGPVFKMEDDPRVLPVGRFLRKYSLDEVPQLFSVLKGDLSLVGPRPPLQTEFKEFDLWQRRKLSVKPGMTCLWQVSGRNEIKNFDDWAKLDLEYIDNWSLWLDCKILFKTLPAVMKGSGK